VYNSSMNRRTFIESSVAAGILVSVPARGFAAMHQIEKVGVQLYTVRDDMKKDFAGTIAKVASAGYKEVEFAGYFDHKPAEVRAILDKNGLTAPSCHFGYDVVQKHLPETLDAAHTIGHTYIVCPWIDEGERKSADGWKRVCETFNKAGEASKKAGIQFGYHNHWWEFAPDAALGGKLAYDHLLESTDADLVKMEMDLAWISVAGQDPVAYFNHYPGRFPLVHVKDFKSLPHLTPQQLATYNSDKLEKEEMTEPGSGVIDWKRLFSNSDKGGIKHFFVEHDAPKDPFASITASYKYLAALRF
jgi:sugar phosphate isomerase/epimerase